MIEWLQGRGRHNSPDRSEGTRLPQIGIIDEVDPLKVAAIWGPVGAEAVLAQLHPTDVSLFHGSMNVIEARREAFDFEAALREAGVKVVRVRDRLAEVLPPLKLDFEQVFSAMVAKADGVKSQFGRQGDCRGLIEELLRQDVAAYGEQQALALNWHLSVVPPIPLGNVMYARDQMNVLFDWRVKAAMARPIRGPEVALYDRVYEEILPSGNGVVSMRNSETFEGGDAYIHDGTVYIGVGARTTFGAALHIYEALREDLEQWGYKFVIVEDTDFKSRPAQEQMDFMHLDTFSNPIGRKQIAVCAREAARRMVTVISSDSEGHIRLQRTGKSFLEYLEAQGDRIVDVPPEEQRNFGCNFLTVNPGLIFVPTAQNGTTNRLLEAAGKRVVHVPLEESTKGWGAAHCMTGQLRRGG
ncbi:MAG: arginine deiminase family protein [bacterium]|nr:arginine deiminase family protein [bacterium]